MSRPTVAIASKAASVAAGRRAVGPAAATSTSVPRSGRARLRLAERDRIGGEQAPHAVGHVPRGQRRAADVADVPVERDRVARGLAGELRAPLGVPDLEAVGLAVVEDLDAAHAAVGVEAERIADPLVLADDLIEQEHAAVGRAPCADLGRGHGDARALRDRALLCLAQDHEVLAQRRAGKEQPLRLGDREVAGRVGGRGEHDRRNAEPGGRAHGVQPAVPVRPAYTPKPAVKRITSPTMIPYVRPRRWGAGRPRASRNRKPSTTGSSSAFMTCTPTESLTRLTPEATTTPPTTSAAV